MRTGEQGRAALGTREFVGRVVIALGLVAIAGISATLVARFPQVPLMLFAAVLGAIFLDENNVVTPLVQLRAVSLAPAFLIAAQLLMGVLLGLRGSCSPRR